MEIVEDSKFFEDLQILKIGIFFLQETINSVGLIYKSNLFIIKSSANAYNEFLNEAKCFVNDLGWNENNTLLMYIPPYDNGKDNLCYHILFFKDMSYNKLLELMQRLYRIKYFL